MDDRVELTKWNRVILIVTHLVKKFPACVLWGFTSTNTDAAVRCVHKLTRDRHVFHQLTTTTTVNYCWPSRLMLCSHTQQSPHRYWRMPETIIISVH